MWGSDGKTSVWQPGALPQQNHHKYPKVLGEEGAAMQEFKTRFFFCAQNPKTCQRLFDGVSLSERLNGG